MRIHTAIISLTLLVTTILTLFLTYYLVDIERQRATSDLQATISRNNQLLKLVNLNPLYSLDQKSLEINLDSFFTDKNMIKIELTEKEGDIHLIRTRIPAEKDKNAKLIQSEVGIYMGNTLLGKVATTYSTATIEDMLKESRNKHYLFSITLLMTLSILLYSLIKHFTSPITRLTVAAKLIAAGDLNQRIEKTGSYELKTLGKSFDVMRNAIKEKIADLARQNQTLEEEIRSRSKIEAENIYLRNLLRNTFDSMPSILVGVNYHGHITQWNRHATEITAIQEKDALNKLFSAILHYPINLESIQKAIIEQTPDKMTKLPGQEQEEFYDITIYPLTGGNVREAVIRIDDATERVRLEEMMIQSEKMLSVGGLAAGMAHEINNPLAGIMQNTQIISNRTKPDMAKNIKAAEEVGVTMEAIYNYMEKREIFSMIDAIMNASTRAARLVENMLTFSRKSDSRHNRANISRILEQTIELAGNEYDLKKNFDFKHIKLIRQYQKNIPEIYCDQSKLQQVFLNILTNGAHAMESFTINGDPPMFTLSIHATDTSVIITIEDNGPGMDSVTVKKVFEPFFTTKEIGKGTGLGLSVSYFIITEEHNGQMEVQSTPNQGATFIITLPKETEQN